MFHRLNIIPRIISWKLDCEMEPLLFGGVYIMEARELLKLGLRWRIEDGESVRVQGDV